MQPKSEKENVYVSKFLLIPYRLSLALSSLFSNFSQGENWIGSTFFNSFNRNEMQLF